MWLGGDLVIHSSPRPLAVAMFFASSEMGKYIHTFNFPLFFCAELNLDLVQFLREYSCIEITK